MKKLTKVLSIVVLVIMLLTSITTVQAASTVMKPSDWDSVTASDKLQTDDIKGFTASLINVIAIVGSAVAIIALIILGMKYMMGSAEEKAEYKKTLLPYFIGAIMVFGASALTGFIYSFINS